MRLREIKQRRQDISPRLPPVRPGLAVAAINRQRGAQNREWLHEQARILDKKIISPRINVHNMTHGVPCNYRKVRALDPLPPPEPIFTKPVVKDGKRVDKQVWFSHVWPQHVEIESPRE